MRFERVAAYPNAIIPTRATVGSAGYDFSAAADICIDSKSIGLIPTGIKAQIDEGYYLQLAIRSSTPKKHGLILANGIGVIDADYYDNPDNEGHIMFQVYNITDYPVIIKAGDRIGQGIFLQYALTNGDHTTGTRAGGFGSTDIDMKKFLDSMFGYNP